MDSRASPFGSLRLRLMVAVGALVAVALVTVGLLSSRIAVREARRYLTEEEARRADAAAQRLRQPLEAHYRDHASWQGVAALLDELALMTDDATALLVLDAELRFVASSETRLQGLAAQLRDGGVLHLSRRAPVSGSSEVAVIELLVARGWVSLDDGAGGEAGTLVVLPGMGEPAPVDSRLPVPAIQGRVMAAVAVAGMLALAATWWLTRRVLAPVSELTQAVKEMAAGRLDRRVTVRSSDEIGALSAAFNSMADGLQRLERLRRSMVSDVAHELRTPLTGIRCQLEAMQDGLMAPERAVLDSLHDDVVALQRLVDDLQELAVAEAGGLDLKLQPVDLEAVTEAVRRSLANGGPVIEINHGNAPRVRADPQRVRQILRNLLANACRHTMESGTVWVSVEASEDMVAVAIEDSGPGIPSDELALVFERFYRVDASRQRSSGGAGLGLAISRQLVQAHGGRIWAESEPGRGARFAFTLPVWHDEG